MSSSPENRAAWLVETGKGLEVKSAPYNKPDPNQIVVRVRAVAINPVDRFIPEMGTMLFNWLKFPVILGSDIAGEVIEVGKDAERFKAGDRVVGLSLGITKGKQDNRQGGFQEYCLLREDMCAPLPAEVSYEDGCVIPLAVCTAACGLYQKDYLNLEHPKIGAKSTGKTTLIWGGSTSIGTNAIQLARSSGYEVFATCSPRNFELVKKLGAAEVFDYNSPTVVQDIVKAFEGKDCAGALSIGNGSVQQCLTILAQLKKTNKFVAMVTPPVQPDDVPKGFFVIASLLMSMFAANVWVWWKCTVTGLKTNFIFGSDLEENEVGPAVWKDFIGDALAKGTFVPSPEAMVEPRKGLEAIEDGFATLKKGVSAKKIVVSI